MSGDWVQDGDSLLRDVVEMGSHCLGQSRAAHRDCLHLLFA